MFGGAAAATAYGSAGTCSPSCCSPSPAASSGTMPSLSSPACVACCTSGAKGSTARGGSAASAGDGSGSAAGADGAGASSSGTASAGASASSCLSMFAAADWDAESMVSPLPVPISTSLTHKPTTRSPSTSKPLSTYLAAPSSVSCNTFARASMIRLPGSACDAHQGAHARRTGGLPVPRDAEERGQDLRFKGCNAGRKVKAGHYSIGTGPPMRAICCFVTVHVQYLSRGRVAAGRLARAGGARGRAGCGA